MNHVSIVMIVKNGEKTIGKSLASLSAFDDVVVYDNGSSDGTKEIVKTFANVTLVEGDFLGFGPTKNKAASFAKHDWVLILDADEVVEARLANTLQHAPLDPNTVYLINFLAFYKTYPIKHCGWNNQKIRRLYNTTRTCFNDNFVHENIIVSEGMTLQELQGGSIEHYSYQSISDFIIKADRYSTLFANDFVGKKRSSPAKAFFNGLYSFFRSYVLKRGFLDGYPGLLISFSHMVSNFYKYLKLYEANKERDRP
ncbi:MAG: glycosyltransferase family 2 protein [Campylobacterales bacterium]|nr:glycosyltransferase family 2 protein [Campylobacterales bacterium]